MSSLYSQVATCFQYPYAEQLHDIESAEIATRQEYPQASGCLKSYLAALQPMDLAKREELFVQTFDVNPELSLDVGYALFGEDYTRGQFMAQLKMEMLKHDVTFEPELPDHLPVMLKLLDRLSLEERLELESTILKPALEKIVKGFTDPHHPFREALLAVHAMLTEDERAAERKF